MFKVLKSGKRQKKSWKRMITKVTFVGAGFTRKPPKYERFIRPTGLRMTKAHVTHPELKVGLGLGCWGVGVGVGVGGWGWRLCVGGRGGAR